MLNITYGWRRTIHTYSGKACEPPPEPLFYTVEIRSFSKRVKSLLVGDSTSSAYRSRYETHSDRLHTVGRRAHSHWLFFGGNQRLFRQLHVMSAPHT